MASNSSRQRRSSTTSETMSMRSKRSEQSVEQMILGSHHVDFNFDSSRIPSNQNNGSYGGMSRPLLEYQHSRTRPSLPLQSRVPTTYSRDSKPPEQEQEDPEFEAEDAAPLTLLIETARSILIPAILWPEIDTLIQLLAQIELYRLQVIGQAEELLRARRSFKPRQSAAGMGGARMGDSETSLKELLSVERQNALRRKYQAIVFAVEKSAIMRRLRNGLIIEADRAFSTYWPTPHTLKHSTPTPLFLLISNTLSPNELDQFEDEAHGMREEMRTIKEWCGSAGQYSHAMFERRFPAAAGGGDKKWVNPALSWMDSVGMIVERIAELASDI